MSLRKCLKLFSDNRNVHFSANLIVLNLLLTFIFVLYFVFSLLLFIGIWRVSWWHFNIDNQSTSLNKLQVVMFCCQNLNLNRIFRGQNVFSCRTWAWTSFSSPQHWYLQLLECRSACKSQKFAFSCSSSNFTSVCASSHFTRICRIRNAMKYRSEAPLANICRDRKKVWWMVKEVQREAQVWVKHRWQSQFKFHFE